MTALRHEEAWMLSKLNQRRKMQDSIQANDSKPIMQLSKNKLKTLLMDDEDLRDQNENMEFLNRCIAAGE